ncbi:hypothetical protein FIBSPDRAFT_1055919 [Athelia psychrophila]|uniref:Uncharacterized protein n=1 Tax=Athelia psychrophila TaxID=1759441 RepID=A0A167SYL9_9AGAM|nr:hypothetical protein FIBSPDRAFT_1055919 [Fibularhizoctonia sp. CBS 109695]
MPGLGRRKMGSLAWGGLTNLFWWIDPGSEGGVARLYASQMLPSGGKISTDLFEAFEKDVYTAHAAIGTIPNMAGIIDHLRLHQSPDWTKLASMSAQLPEDQTRVTFEIITYTADTSYYVVLQR